MLPVIFMDTALHTGGVFAGDFTADWEDWDHLAADIHIQKDPHSKGHGKHIFPCADGVLKRACRTSRFSNRPSPSTDNRRR